MGRCQAWVLDWAGLPGWPMAPRTCGTAVLEHSAPRADLASAPHPQLDQDEPTAAMRRSSRRPRAGTWQPRHWNAILNGCNPPALAVTAPPGRRSLGPGRGSWHSEAIEDVFAPDCSRRSRPAPGRGAAVAAGDRPGPGSWDKLTPGRSTSGRKVAGTAPGRQPSCPAAIAQAVQGGGRGGRGDAAAARCGGEEDPSLHQAA